MNQQTDYAEFYLYDLALTINNLMRERLDGLRSRTAPMEPAEPGTMIALRNLTTNLERLEHQCQQRLAAVDAQSRLDRARRLDRLVTAAGPKPNDPLREEPPIERWEPLETED